MLRSTCAGAIGLLLAGSLAPAEAAESGKETRRAWSSQRGRLGVSLEDVRRDDLERLQLEEETGARVSGVTDDSPASAAGLKEDDVILRFQGETVHSAAQLARLVRETPPGRKVQLELSRQGAVQQVTATLAEGKGLAVGFGNFEQLESLGELPVPPDATRDAGDSGDPRVPVERRGPQADR